MAEKRFKFQADTSSSPKPPSFGGKTNSVQNTLELLIMKQMLGEQQAKQQVENLGPGFSPTKATIENVTYENPVLSGQMKEQETAGQRLAETAPSRAVMRGTLVKAKQLADTVPPTKPGIGRIIQGVSNQFKGDVTQEIPQISEYHKMVDSTLTAFARTMFAEKGNVANWDIARVKKAFSDIAWDTEDSRALSWNRAIDTYNEVMSSYKNIDPEELIDKREMMSPKEIGRARVLSGNTDFSDLSDEELAGAYVPNDKAVPRPFKEAMLKEVQRRKSERMNQNV